nr:potassium-transporting ATPase subunit KdpA [uncultured Macellibacteroides sp.]
MNREFIGCLVQIILVTGLSYPLGKHLSKVYKGEKNWLDIMAPLERLIYKFSGINASEEMSWKHFLRVLLTCNLFWFVWGMCLLVIQEILPLNPDGNPGQTVHQAFNTSISFLVNANLQHYSGESGLTYFTQLFVIMLFQFLAAATGMAAMAGLLKALASKNSGKIGNFWVYLVTSCTRVLLPLALVVGFILIVEGVPMTFEGKKEVVTMEGTTQLISQGPVAAIVAIKQLGTNGGGFFGANAAHPLENPTYLSNMVNCMSILLLPMSFVMALGFYLKRKKLAYTIFAVMLIALLTGIAVTTYAETQGNPFISAMGIDQSGGAMEGKESRLGAVATALWGAVTTATSNGSVNGMHDSLMPLSGLVTLLNMQVNSWFGGVGVGFMNYYIFIIIAVFISGLMVGRTPEFLGKKVEAKEMKIAILLALLHPFVILGSTALASWMAVNNPALTSQWLNNPSFHGFTEMLYEYTSSAANNGSGFEGLKDSNAFWDISCGLVLVVSRFIPIVGQIAIAGILAQKRFVPESAGTLKTDTGTFALMTFTVILIIAALSFFPVLTLGPLAEHVTMFKGL